MIRLTGAEMFADGWRGTYRKRLSDMSQFEVLCAANECRRDDQDAVADALMRWQHRMHQTPRQRPPDAA